MISDERWSAPKVVIHHTSWGLLGVDGVSVCSLQRKDCGQMHMRIEHDMMALSSERTESVATAFLSGQSIAAATGCIPEKMQQDDR